MVKLYISMYNIICILLNSIPVRLGIQLLRARPRDMSILYIPMAEHLQVLNNTTRAYRNNTYYDNIIIIIPGTTLHAALIYVW